MTAARDSDQWRNMEEVSSGHMQADDDDDHDDEGSCAVYCLVSSFDCRNYKKRARETLSVTYQALVVVSGVESGSV